LTPSVAIVAFAAEDPLSPRGERARVVAEAVGRIASAELIFPSGHPRLRRRVRQLLHVGSPLLLDAWELEAWWTLRRPRARPHSALLVGFPFSAVYWAARWLVRERVRYVVDLGDPWTLTLPADERPPMGRVRAARCEEFVWRSASAAIVTTELQAEPLQPLFPRLPVVVRPNGYRSVPMPTAQSARPRAGRTLRLVHYGNIYEARLDIVPLIAHLANCGEWESVYFMQQGYDWTGALRRMPPAVHVEVSKQQPWDEVVATAGDYDLALVMGNRNPAQLPSKAVQYLTLPIPRLAVVGRDASDALSAYVRGKPGWLTLPWDAASDLAGKAVASHVRRVWSLEALAPPPSESWDAVAGMLVDVLRAHTGGQWK
jgi:hypothetical protein